MGQDRDVQERNRKFEKEKRIKKRATTLRNEGFMAALGALN